MTNMKKLKKRLKNLGTKILKVTGFMCECGCTEKEEYGYYGYLRCAKCKKRG